MREGSRPGVLERKKEEKKPVAEKPQTYLVKPRPMVVHGSTYRIDTPVGAAFITINTNGNMEPLEVFINVGKAGTDVYAMAEGLGRVISLALRFGSHLSPKERVKQVAEQLQGIGGARSHGFGKEKIRSLPDAVAKVLSMHFGLNGQAQKSAGNGQGNGQSELATELKKMPEEKPTLVSSVSQPSLMQPNNSDLFDICPSCGEASLAHEEGCAKCYGCGYAEC